ncbi:anion permease [Aestuariirhabdus sp. Z084]|uniref:DASS family sodium-coupled anion symporter n=1 Tax=Aestuariirhabdus haliotis TaxID=2918751 RepID=UPI00201B42A3|nr:DASS family sodium-coupled anion symporter [Aestuariirhabdus haliotis]MCL6416266.1 anion permease [Aestuariirhabdus haliotis]MCL6420274.1 anion permease [Aestuariirhabdus haliotis]
MPLFQAIGIGRAQGLQLLIMIGSLLLWWSAVPEGLTEPAWKLFVVFITTIALVISGTMAIFTAAIIGVSAAMLTGTLTAEQAFLGFSQDFILLIIVAFLIARGVVNSGLGKRIAYLIISRFGYSSLGLSYSIVAADMLIAPAFPSNTARSGVLFPIVNALASDSGSNPDDGTRRRIGAYLMFCSMAGLSISSALWLTAMAANPAGVAMAQDMGINITFGSWFFAASVPCLVAFLVVPRVLYVVFPPGLQQTPEAPAAARESLRAMGPVSYQEWVVGATFIVMVLLWVFSKSLGINNTAVAFSGLAVLMLSGVFTIDDLHEEGRALDTLVWFAILYAMSSNLNAFGFMAWLGGYLADWVGGFDWGLVFALLVVSYVVIHYFFVSQTAQLLALFSVFLGVGLNAGVPGELMALMLLFATNFMSVIAPQGSSANVIYLASGYIEASEVYRYGGIVTAVNSLIFLTVGTAWILLVT